MSVWRLISWVIYWRGSAYIAVPFYSTILINLLNHIHELLVAVLKSWRLMVDDHRVVQLFSSRLLHGMPSFSPESETANKFPGLPQ
jgi:hypothetical protein